MICFNILFINNIIFMLEGDSPRKNLWKNLNTQKAKYSYVQQTNNSPVISNSKDSNHNSEPLRPLSLEKHSRNNSKHKQLLLNFDNVEKQIDLRLQQCPNFMESGTDFLQKIGESQQRQIKNTNNAKSRRLSIGEQSVVQQVVDFKYQNILQIGDEEDQQPMIMSLGSQSNPVIRLLKLSKMKDEIEKLQNLKSDILKYITEQKIRYKEFFQASFHQTLAFVIEFYSDKIESDWEKNIGKSQNQTRITHIRKGKSLVSEDTPRFAKHMSSITSQNVRKSSHQIDQSLQNQVEHLQQEIFKEKTKNEALSETIEKLRKENDQLNQQIFDYTQKIAQFELEVNQRVQQMLDKKMKDSFRQRSLQEAQSQRKQYLDQILSLEKQIEKLEQRSYHTQYAQIQQQLIKREEYLIERQKQIYNKQRQLNQLQIQLNSEKLELQRKYKNFHLMENQLRSSQSKLEQIQIQLALKQKQIRSKQLQRLQDENNGSATQSGVFKQPNTDYNYQLDFKLKSLSYKESSITKPKNLRDDKEWHKNNSSVGGQSGKYWRYPILSQKSDSYKKSTYSVTRKSNSKQKQKQRQRQKRSHEKTHVIVNKISTPTNKVHPQNHSFSHLNNFKAQDKNRLEDLGTKLENLRNQIRKQIRDSE